ncbi:MAG TPA: hypothetical protein VIG72_15300 [Pontibacter sp.]
MPIVVIVDFGSLLGREAPSSGIALLPSCYPPASDWLRHRNKSKALNPKTVINSIVAA